MIFTNSVELQVYKGWHNYSPVAIKVLQVDSPKALKDALDEMKVLTKIHSPNIVRLLGYTITEEVFPSTPSPPAGAPRLFLALVCKGLHAYQGLTIELKLEKTVSY